MKFSGTHVWAALIIAVFAHLTFVHLTPRVMMSIAIDRIGDGRVNFWRFGERVTPTSRTIVRPSPDFAYAACPYDLRDGPVLIQVAPWDQYWSLSLYADNSDNFFTLNDREARFGGEVTLVRAGSAHPEGASMVVESPSQRGIALMRRLAPRVEDFAAAAAVAREDVCASAESLRHTS
ncbi:hypothetical protein U91I_01156 [alpha proteobacterium U9-1i]|nr:hypothetical protein U91I_01156 [alpha proteobacterium U9-1i]